MTQLRSFVLAAGLLVSTSALIAPAFVSLASAQPPSTEDRSTSFRAVTGGAREDVPGGNLLVAAYGLVLVALVGYVIYVGAIQQGTAREMSRLEKLVAARRASLDAEDRPGSRPAKD